MADTAAPNGSPAAAGGNPAAGRRWWRAGRAAESGEAEAARAGVEASQAGTDPARGGPPPAMPRQSGSPASTRQSGSAASQRQSGSPASRSEAILRRLEWTVIRRLDGALHGDYRTLFRGAGLDLADLREYQYNDDVRHIDWNVTARLQVPYVREFHEDRELAAWFLVDLSASVDFGSGDTSKQMLAAEFVAVLARVLSRRGNRVGLLRYGSRVDKVIGPRAGRRHVLHLLATMLERPALAPKQTDLAEMLGHALRVVRRRSLVFLISDFISVPGWASWLARLARRHEVIAIRLYDPLELKLPDIGGVLMQDAETGEQIWVDTNDAGFRRRFAAAAAKREQALRGALADAGVDTLELSTADDLFSAILRFAELRKRRSQLAAGGGLPMHLRLS
jgi:uncharacterized protein (DUF58 family)